MSHLSGFEKFYVVSTLICLLWTGYAAWFSRFRLSKWRMMCLAGFHPICFTVDFRPDPVSDRALLIYALICLLPVLNVLVFGLYALPFLAIQITSWWPRKDWRARRDTSK